ncbi:glycoside hydrolase family 2 TIM barrel-domain containing protein [Paenibacillus sp. BK720]|uniref:glycoside hydrolase family 2 TIM barrel-domain containing protein n=1 Tax=Paenibacillus sp. BK720 TaxID=2587092 RepID=UPI001421F36D|nr:glycoside hydrolase family 2 TIM barrel-domain containing protein [Paenibacillus sp. BK720]NIK69303.1 beta-glucuronidase [Paenibacillus sp. BK720]
MLKTTLTLENLNGVNVPFQNGIPVPSFEPQTREKITLNGEWRKRRLSMDHDFSMAARSDSWLAELEEREGEYVSGDLTEQWQPHAVPSPENKLTGLPEANAAETYEDGVWYRRAFAIASKNEGYAYTLKSLGISYVADIWINGEWVGCHEGGFTPFAFDLTAYLRTGDNEIRIRVDNPPWGSRADTIPADAGTDFFNYTGIIHDLYIEITPQAAIVRADIVPLDVSGRLNVKVVLHNRGKAAVQVGLEGSLLEADPEAPNFLDSPLASTLMGVPAVTDKPMHSELTLQPDEVKVVQFEVTVREPKLWSVWQPNLYVATFRLTAAGSVAQAQDSFSTQFGIRTVRTDKTRILLNEQSVFMAGIARHEEWPDTGRTAAWDRIRTDLEQIRALNVNMVRTGHYPNHVYTYLLLDRMGFMAMSEIPLWQFETEHYEAQGEKRLADQMWREMVFSQYNRPSVLMWSTQNESKDVWLRLAYNERLVRDLRENYNDGRLLTQSSAADQPGPHDPSMAPLDVAAWTMYFGIFHGGTYYEGTRQFLEEANRIYPDKPILNTEFGHWSSDGNEGEQVLTYEETLRALIEKGTLTAEGEDNPDGYVAGIDFWIMYDWYVNHNNWIDTFGIIHMDRSTEKPVAPLIRRDYGAITRLKGGLGQKLEGAANEKV